MARSTKADTKAESFSQKLKTTVKNLPTTVLASAAAALGAAVVAGVPVVGSWAMSYWNSQQLVAILNEPIAPIHAQTPIGNGGLACGPGAGVTPVALTKHQRSVELWKRWPSGSRVVAQVTDEKDIGHGEVVGFEKARNGAAAFDTITAAFDGGTVGRGTYYLERMEGDRWWRGTHTFYDCHRLVKLKCNIVLGPTSVRSEMEQDPWLSSPCSPEESALRPVSPPRTASN